MSNVSIRAERKRRKIIAAAQREFFLKGFDKTTIEDITDRLNISKGNFYYYFSSKEEILIAVCENLIENEVMKLKAVNDEVSLPVESRMISILNVMFDTFYENESFWGHIHKDRILHNQVFATVKSRLTDFITRLLKEGKDKGAFNVPFPEEIGGIMLSIMDWSAGQYCSTSDESKREHIIDAMEHTYELILGESCKPIFLKKELRRAQNN